MNTKTMIENQVDMTTHKDKLMEDLQLVVADAEELLRATASQAGEGAATARARIQNSLKVAKSRIADAETAVIERTKRAAKEADKYVHDNPWQSVGVSAIVGVAVGMLIARR